MQNSLWERPLERAPAAMPAPPGPRGDGSPPLGPAAPRAAAAGLALLLGGGRLPGLGDKVLRTHALVALQEEDPPPVTRAEVAHEAVLERELRYVLAGAAVRAAAAGGAAAGGEAAGGRRGLLRLARQPPGCGEAWPDFDAVEAAVDAHLERLARQCGGEGRAGAGVGGEPGERGAAEAAGTPRRVDGARGELPLPAEAGSACDGSRGEEADVPTAVGSVADGETATADGTGASAGAGAGGQGQANGAGEADGQTGQAAVQQAADAGGSGPRAEPPAQQGRHGILAPAHDARVRMEARALSGRINFDRSGRLESLSNFSSARANACVYAGRWMYEVCLGTSGIQQLGWVTLACPFTNEEGVGDAPNSYAYDGKRVKKWSVESSEYGQQWAKGDVIGCLTDLDAGEISYTRNGTPLGVAFRGVRSFAEGLAYFPAVSLSHGEKCDINFGERPFQHPVQGFAPLQEAPEQADLARAGWLAECLGRVARASKGGGGGPGDDACCSSASRGALAETHSLLLVRLLSDRLMPLVQSDYVVAEALLPVLMRLMGDDCAQQLATIEREAVASGAAGAATPSHGVHLVVRLIDSVAACAEAADVRRLLRALFEATALGARTRLIFPVREGAATSSKYCALALAMARSDTVMDMWSAMPEFYWHVEGLLAMKAPNDSDLEAVFVSTPLPPRRADSVGLSTWIDGVAEPFKLHQQLSDDLKASLLRRMLLFRPAGQARRGGRLMTFVQHVVRKNRGATRNIPPPGLSDPTVLVALYFGLLRLMRPLLHSTEALAWQPGNLLPVYADDLDYPRVGGAISHLRKYGLMPAERLREMQPVQVFGAGSGAGGLLNAAMKSLAGRDTPGVRQENEPIPAGAEPPVSFEDGIERPRFAGEGDHAEEGSSASGGVSQRTARGTPLELQHGCEDASPVDCTVQEGFALLDVVVVLYHMSVCQAFKQASWFHAQQQASIANLGETERSLEERQLVAARDAAAARDATEQAAEASGSGQSDSAADGGGGSTGEDGAGGSDSGTEDASAPQAEVATTTDGDVDQDGGDGDGRSGSGIAQASSTDRALNDLRRARDALRDDALASVRSAAYQRVSLQSPRMQANVLAVTGLLARLVLTLSARSDLWAWVPECYIEAMLDAFHALRRSDLTCTAAFSVKDPTVTAMVTFLAVHADDVRIINPDVRDIVLQSASVLLQYSDYLASFQESEVAKFHLMGACFLCFDQRFWIPAANIMLRLCRARGFHPKYSRSQQYAGPGQIYRAALREELAKPETLAAFMDRALNTLNWTASEFHVSLMELADARQAARQSHFPAVPGVMGEAGRARQGGGGSGGDGRRQSGDGAAGGGGRTAGVRGASVTSIAQQPQLMRKCNIMYELSVNLLCLLEVVCIESPKVFLGDEEGCSLSLGRLAEVLAFVLTLTTVGSGAALFNDTLALLTPQLGKISRQGILGPVTSILVTLHMAARQLKSLETVADALATARGDSILPCLEYLQGMSSNSSSSSSNPEHVHRAELIGVHAAVQACLDARAEPDEAPDEFIDPICSEIMRDPVMLPSGVVCERSVIERHLLTDATDPFSRAELSKDMLVPQTELKAQIVEWVSAERKRRKEGIVAKTVMESSSTAPVAAEPEPEAKGAAAADAGLTTDAMVAAIAAAEDDMMSVD